MKGMNIKDLEREEYKEIEKIDLVNNKKEAVLVNILGLVIVVVMMALLPLLIKVGIVRSYRDNLLLSLVVFVLSLILYIPFHEIVHGLVLKFYTDEKISFGWKFLYAYCGSKTAVVKRGEYYLVALAPLAVFSLVFILLMVLNPTLSFVWYLMEIMNFSGCIGDIYVSFKLSKKREKDILITDSGTDMSFWSR